MVKFPSLGMLVTDASSASVMMNPYLAWFCFIKKYLREVLLIFPQQSFLLGCLQGCIPFPRNLEVIRIATWAYTGLNARFDKGSVGLIVVGKRCYRSNIKYCWRCAQQTGDTSRSYCSAISCHAISSKVFPCLIYASARSAWLEG